MKLKRVSLTDRFALTGCKLPKIPKSYSSSFGRELRVFQACCSHVFKQETDLLRRTQDSDQDVKVRDTRFSSVGGGTS